MAGSRSRSRWRTVWLRLTSGWLLGGYALGLLVATHAPTHFRTSTRILGFSLDHWAHGLFYAPLTLLTLGFMSQARWDSFWRRRRLAAAPILLLIAAAVDEYTQSLPGINRSTQLADFIGDALGILIVAVIAAAWLLARRTVVQPRRR